jgi:hypothetical protein
MRKLSAILLPALLCLQAAYGQKINEDNIKIGKAEAKGYVATSKYSKAQVDEALAGELERVGLKKHGKMKKFYTFMAADWPTLSPNKVDVYYKVQKKKHHAKIYFIASKGYDNYITSASEPTLAAGINNFLGGIDAAVARNEAIKQKEQEVKVAGDKLEQDKANVQKAADDKARKTRELETMRSPNTTSDK